MDQAARTSDFFLKALIVYEDMVTGKQAKETCDSLALELGPDWQIEMEASSFKSLQIPQLQEYATAAATNSDLILFSCYGQKLPKEVWRWTELNLKRSNQPKALIAHVDNTRSPAGSSLKMEQYLADLARRRGMRFFAHHPIGPQATRPLSSSVLFSLNPRMNSSLN